MSKVYELNEGETLVAMTHYHDDLIIATTHRLFKMRQEWDGDGVGSKKVYRIEPILLEREKEDA